LGKVKPNALHDAIEELESVGILESVITQKINNMYQQVGSKIAYKSIAFGLCVEDLIINPPVSKFIKIIRYLNQKLT